MDTVFTRLHIGYTYVVIVFIVVLTDLYWDTGYIFASTFNAYRDPNSMWNVHKVKNWRISTIWR